MKIGNFFLAFRRLKWVGLGVAVDAALDEAIDRAWKIRGRTVRLGCA